MHPIGFVSLESLGVVGREGSSDWVQPDLRLTFLPGTETLGKKHPLSGPPSLISKVLSLAALRLRIPHTYSTSQKPQHHSDFPTGYLEEIHLALELISKCHPGSNP